MGIETWRVAFLTFPGAGHNYGRLSFNCKSLTLREDWSPLFVGERNKKSFLKSSRRESNSLYETSSDNS